jgi:hypothetical protein
MPNKSKKKELPREDQEEKREQYYLKTLSLSFMEIFH